MDPKGGGFKRGSDNPLECDLLVVDETSMVDVTVDAGVELVRRENAAVSSNQRALFIDEHHDGPAPLADRGGDLRHLLVGMSACIAGVGDEFCDRPPLDLDPQATPPRARIMRAPARARKWREVLEVDLVDVTLMQASSCCAASTRPCPAISVPCSSTSTGMVKPNSRIEAAICATCSGE